VWPGVYGGRYGRCRVLCGDGGGSGLIGGCHAGPGGEGTAFAHWEGP